MFEHAGRDGGAAGDSDRAEPERNGLGRDGNSRVGAAGKYPPERLDPGNGTQRCSDVLEAQPESLTGSVEQRADRRAAQRKVVGELAIGKPADLPEKQHVALRSRQLRDLFPDNSKLGALDRFRRNGRSSAVGCLGRGGNRDIHPSAASDPALVAGDRGKPRCRILRESAVQKCAMDRQEHLLGRVLCLGTVAEKHPADPRDGTTVLPVQRIGPPAGCLDVAEAPDLSGSEASRRRRRPHLAGVLDGL